MLDCPNCGATAYDGTVCSACRFSVGGKKSAAIVDPDHLRCSNVFQGQRCAELGTLSQGTRGEGPWYCHKHFPPFFGRYLAGKPSPPPGGFQALKSVLRKIDPEANAERLAIQGESA